MHARTALKYVDNISLTCTLECVAFGIGAQEMSDVPGLLLQEWGNGQHTAGEQSESSDQRRLYRRIVLVFSVRTRLSS